MTPNDAARGLAAWCHKRWKISWPTFRTVGIGARDDKPLLVIYAGDEDRQFFVHPLMPASWEGYPVEIKEMRGPIRLL